MSRKTATPSTATTATATTATISLPLDINDPMNLGAKLHAIEAGFQEKFRELEKQIANHHSRTAAASQWRANSAATATTISGPTSTTTPTSARESVQKLQHLTRWLHQLNPTVAVNTPTQTKETDDYDNHHTSVTPTVLAATKTKVASRSHPPPTTAPPAFEQVISFNEYGQEWECSFINLDQREGYNVGLTSTQEERFQQYVMGLFRSPIVVLEKTPGSLSNVIVWQRTEDGHCAGLILPPSTNPPVDPNMDLTNWILHQTDIVKCSTDLTPFVTLSAFAHKENRFLHLNCFDGHSHYPQRPEHLISTIPIITRDTVRYACQTLVFAWNSFPILFQPSPTTAAATTAAAAAAAAATAISGPLPTTQQSNHLSPTQPAATTTTTTTKSTSARKSKSKSSPPVSSTPSPRLTEHEQKLLQWMDTTTLPLSKDINGFIGNVLNATIFSKKRGNEEKAYIKSLVSSLREKGYLVHLRD